MDLIRALHSLPHVHPADRSAPWFRAPNYYPVYERVATVLQPRSVLEIGARLGYSLVALAHGSRRLRRFWWVDDESYLAGSNRDCAANLVHYFRTGRPESAAPLLRCAPALERLPDLPPWGVDLAHVDGDHSYAGTLRDLEAVWERARVVLCDDYRLPSVGRAVRDWAASRAAPYLVFDTPARGLVAWDRSPEARARFLLLESRLPILEAPPGWLPEGGVPAPRERVAGQCCPLCGGRGTRAGERDGYDLRKCRCRGGVLLSFPWLDEAAYEGWYRTPGLYHADEQEANGQEPSFRRDTEHLAAAAARLQVLGALGVRSGRLLDVGAGTGSFVAAASGAGFAAAGLEPAPEIADLARRLGRNLRSGTWRDVAGAWDVITLHDVFEHLTRPWDCLERLQAALAPGGLLVIETPEYLCPRSRQEGAAWKHVRPLQHVCLYSEPAARHLFQAAGWRVEAVIRPLRGTVGKIAFYLSPEAGP